MTLRKVIKAWASFPSEKAATKLLYRALRNAAKKWKFVQAWAIALNHFNLLWGDRIEGPGSGVAGNRWPWHSGPLLSSVKARQQPALAVHLARRNSR